MRTNFILNISKNQKKVRDGERSVKPDTYGSKTKFRVAIIARTRKGGKMFQVAIDPVTEDKTMASREVYALNAAGMVVVGLDKHIDLPRNKATFRWMARHDVRAMRALAGINGGLGFVILRERPRKATVAR